MTGKRVVADVQNIYRELRKQGNPGSAAIMTAAIVVTAFVISLVLELGSWINRWPK